MVRMNNVSDDFFLKIDETGLYFGIQFNYDACEKGQKGRLFELVQLSAGDALITLLRLLMERSYLYLLFLKLLRMKILERFAPNHAT